jgi:hypothetical protein
MQSYSTPAKQKSARPAAYRTVRPTEWWEVGYIASALLAHAIKQRDTSAPSLRLTRLVQDLERELRASTAEGLAA